MKTKVLCLDMDGTIADLYSVPNWLDDLEHERMRPFLEAKPMWDMNRLRDILIKLSAQGWEIRIISWLSKNSSEQYKTAVRVAKKLWLNQYKLPLDAIHLVQYGTTKADCIRRYAEGAILVDDNQKVRDGWHLGETIDPMDGDLLEKLEKLLDK